MGRSKMDFVVFVVLQAKDGGDMEETDQFSVLAGVEDTTAGRKWIRENGVEGQVYQIGAFTSPVLRVRAEQKTVRTFIEDV